MRVRSAHRRGSFDPWVHRTFALDKTPDVCARYIERAQGRSFKRGGGLSPTTLVPAERARVHLTIKHESSFRMRVKARKKQLRPFPGPVPDR